MKPIEECTTLQELYENPSHWTKGSGDNKTCFCLMYGCDKIYKDRLSVWMKVEKSIKDYIEKLTKQRGIVPWNDAPKRTIEDIRKLVKELNI